MQQGPINQSISGEKLEHKLNILGALMTTLWANPLIRDDEAILGLQVLEESLLHLRGLRSTENWQRLHEKGVRILEVILRGMIRILVGVQLSLDVRLRVCHLGEVLCIDHRRCGDRELLMKVVGMYSK